MMVKKINWKFMFQNSLVFVKMDEADWENPNNDVEVIGAGFKEDEKERGMAPEDRGEEGKPYSFQLSFVTRLIHCSESC